MYNEITCLRFGQHKNNKDEQENENRGKQIDMNNSEALRFD